MSVCQKNQQINSHIGSWIWINSCTIPVGRIRNGLVRLDLELNNRCGINLCDSALHVSQWSCRRWSREATGLEKKRKRKIPRLRGTNLPSSPLHPVPTATNNAALLALPNKTYTRPHSLSLSSLWPRLVSRK